MDASHIIIYMVNSLRPHQAINFQVNYTKMHGVSIRNFLEESFWRKFQNNVFTLHIHNNILFQNFRWYGSSICKQDARRMPSIIAFDTIYMSCIHDSSSNFFHPRPVMTCTIVRSLPPEPACNTLASSPGPSGPGDEACNTCTSLVPSPLAWKGAGHETILAPCTIGGGWSHMQVDYLLHIRDLVLFVFLVI